MVATLPGRTHGLGLFTEPIRRTFGLDRESYGILNLWATLVGAAFCFRCGWLLDRIGIRLVLAGVTLALGAVVVADEPGHRRPGWVRARRVARRAARPVRARPAHARARAERPVGGQPLAGRPVGRPTRTGLAMGVYSFLVAVGFMAAFAVVREVDPGEPGRWRTLWAGIGWRSSWPRAAVPGPGRATACWKRLTVADAPGSPDGPHAGPGAADADVLGVRPRHVASTGWSSAGMSLFNQSILAERGFDQDVFLNVTIIGIPVGLAANLLAGWLATRSLARVRARPGRWSFMAAALACVPVRDTRDRGVRSTRSRWRSRAG